MYRKRLTINGKECKMVTSPEDDGISTFFTIPHPGVQSTQPVTGKFGGTLCAACHRAPRRRFAFKRRGVGRYGRTSDTRGRGNRCSASGRRGFAAYIGGTPRPGQAHDPEMGKGRNEGHARGFSGYFRCAEDPGGGLLQVDPQPGAVPPGSR